MKMPLIELVESVKAREGVIPAPEVMAMVRAIGRYAGLVAALATVVSDAIEAMYPNNNFPPAVGAMIEALACDMESVRNVELPNVN